VQEPPQPIPAQEIMPENLPEAWRGADETTALAISDALSAKMGKILPWITVRETVSTALNSRWLERSIDSGPVQSDYSGARALKICVRKDQPQQPKAPAEGPRSYTLTPPPQPGLLVAEADLSSDKLQDFDEILPEILTATAETHSNITLRLRMELTAASPLPTEAIEKINKLLQEVSEDLKLHSV
jgi:hypothetical protein